MHAQEENQQEFDFLYRQTQVFFKGAETETSFSHEFFNH